MRRHNRIPSWISKAYHDYTKCRQTFADLSDRYGKDPKTIRKEFDKYYPVTGEIHNEKQSVNIIVDVTFFKIGDGVLVARANGENLYWSYVETEKIEHYERCMDSLEAMGYTLLSFTIDGRRGVRNALQKRYPNTPIQHCQFHQIQTITIKLTKRPKLEASKELRDIALTLTQSTREEFTSYLDAWHEKWNEFIKEKTVSLDLKRKWRWKHEKLRSAYFSLRRNLPWLFTYLDHPDLNIPNTTNSCDGSFSHWKNKVKIHRGIRRDRKKKMINYLLN